jgi:hypothetical protein
MVNFQELAIAIITLNILLFMSQLTITDLYSDGTEFCNSDGLFTSTFLDSSGTVIANNTNEFIPTSSNPVSSGALSWIDSLSTIINWITGKAVFFAGMLKAPVCLLENMLFLPHDFALLLGLFWYLISGLALFFIIVGRN